MHTEDSGRSRDGRLRENEWDWAPRTPRTSTIDHFDADPADARLVLSLYIYEMSSTGEGSAERAADSQAAAACISVMCAESGIQEVSVDFLSMFLDYRGLCSPVRTWYIRVSPKCQQICHIFSYIFHCEKFN